MIEDLWYKSTVIYSLDVKSFMDSDGDGTGDFEGLSRRLDYLKALGIGTVWLAPCQQSPDRDNGYDIADFYAIDPRYGSNGDFVEFMHQAKKRGIKVVLDLVLNHTSDQHKWFKEARKDPSSRYRDWYIWSKKRPKDWNEGMVFPGVQHTTWTYDEQAEAYYYHRFYEFQPDLNMDNPQVRAEARRVMGYWLELGVAGFRVDAVPFLIESTSPGKSQGALNFDYLAEFRRLLQWRSGDAILLGEANVLPKESKRYFGHDGGTGVHMMFNFFVNQHLFYALATADVAPLAEALTATKNIPETSQWAQFLRNHDELDLGRLDEEQREKVFERFGPDEDMQLYHRGIRRRLAPMLGNRQHLEFAYSVMFSLPGTPVIRYGDEIGMGEDLSLKERDAVRTPMQWANEPQAGFSKADKTVYPVVDKGVYSYKQVNVEAQQRDPGSLLNWMRKLIRVRQECPEIGWGDWKILKSGDPRVLAMRYDWRGNSIVVVHNFDERACEVKLKPDVDGGERLVDLLAEDESRADGRGVHLIPLEAYGYRWFRVGGLNHAIRRERE
ncbi:MAG: trehalose synthase [Planctomycetaceae bacterium]|nr:trehalose synthase [Planctomycetaceae bacterium]